LFEFLFSSAFLEEVFAIALGILVYDYVLDPFLEGIWKGIKKRYKRRKRSFTERQGIKSVNPPG